MDTSPAYISLHRWAVTALPFTRTGTFLNMINICKTSEMIKKITRGRLLHTATKVTFPILSSEPQRTVVIREGEREREKEAGRGREGGREIVRVSNWLAYLSTRRREEKLLRRATKTINSYYY